MSRWHANLGLARRMFGVECPAGFGCEMRSVALGPVALTLWRFYPVIWP